MTQGLYIAGTGPKSGKSVVVLGMMELLSAQGRKVGFFRPIIRTNEGPDTVIDLTANRFNLEHQHDAMYGCAYETARELIASGKIDELHTRILEKYKALESRCEFVLCLGTDFTGVTTAIEFDFNADVANNLGCPILPVINGHERSDEEVVDAVRFLKDSLEERRCEVFAIIVNRMSTDRINTTREKMQRTMRSELPVYVMPEVPLLGKPTVGEIAWALQAERINGNGETLEDVVDNFKVAAMELPNFLDHIEDGSLIIVPGDRSDIILGSLIADASGTYPKIAGILLSGNLKPASQVQRLLQGLLPSTVPIFAVPTDTFTTAMNANSVKGTILPESKRKIAAALGVMETSVDLPELEKRIAVSRSDRVTPLRFEYDLIQRAKSRKRHIVLPEGTDDRILRASEILLLRGVADLSVLGNREKVLQRINTLGLSLENLTVIDPASSQLRESFARTYYELRKHKGISEGMAYDAMADVSYFGTMMVHHGHADGMVSGAAHTTQHTIRPAFEIIKTKPGFSIVSSVFLMCLPDRVLVYGDCAVNPNPSAEQLADIAISSAATAEMFEIEPRVAMLSYSSGSSGKGEDVERVRDATRIAKERRPDLKLDGPIQYDAAVDASVARSKMPDSEVAGNATVFIFPDLNTGNNTYKAVQRSAGAVAIGPILQGLRKPVNDLSRGCTVPDIVNTVAITAIQAQKNEENLKE